MLNINELAQKCLKIARARMRNGSRIDSDPLKALAGETIEAAEARMLVSLDIVCPKTKAKAKDNYAEELADAAICVMTAAADDGIDLEDAILKKIDKNEKRALEMGDKL